MSVAYHVVIGTEEIRIPLSELEGFRNAVLIAARDGASWVPLQVNRVRRTELLITPYTAVRIERVDFGGESEGEAESEPPAQT